MISFIDVTKIPPQPQQKSRRTRAGGNSRSAGGTSSSPRAQPLPSAAPSAAPTRTSHPSAFRAAAIAAASCAGVIGCNLRNLLVP